MNSTIKSILLAVVPTLLIFVLQDLYYEGKLRLAKKEKLETNEISLKIDSLYAVKSKILDDYEAVLKIKNRQIDSLIKLTGNDTKEMLKIASGDTVLINDQRIKDISDSLIENHRLKLRE